MVLLQALLRENGGQYILMTRFPHVAVLIGRKKLEEETGPLGLRPMQKCGVIMKTFMLRLLLLHFIMKI